MIIYIKKRAILFARWLAILLMIFVFGFSDLVYFLPNNLQNNEVVDNFKIKTVRAIATYETKGAFTFGNGNLSVPVPAGYQDDDVFLLFVESANEAITTPVGWTQVANSPQFTGTAATAGGVRLGVFYKIVLGAQSNVAINDAGNHTTAIIANFRGIDPISPIHITAGSVDASATNAIVTPSVTTSIADTMIVNVIGLDKDANDTNTITTAPVNASLTGLAEGHDQTVTTGVGGGIAFFTGIKSTAGAVGMTTASADTSTTHAYITISLKPRPDINPPLPDPMIFSSVPVNDSASQVSMISAAGSDATTPVNYLFTNNNSACGADGGTGGTSSAWQSGTSYNDAGLQPNKCYGYTITARDSVTPTPNTGTASGISSTYTSANVPGTPTLNSATSTTLNLTNAENNNPSTNPTTSFAVQVVTTTPNDPTWINQWINDSGNPSAIAVWLTDAQLDALVLQGLQPSTLYGIKVKARNQDGDETVLGTEGQGTTSAQPAPDATSVSYQVGGDGARSGYSATIDGSNFGNISAGSRDNCTGGAGTGCVRFIVGGNATVADTDVTVWSNNSITFTVSAGLASEGGAASLQVIRAGLSDSTPLNFYIYPTITSLSANNGMIGSTITVSGDHFGTGAGSVSIINNPATVVGGWNETSLTIRIPGQQGTGITTGKIQLSRSDSKTSNQYPSAGNFTIDPPQITSSSSSPVTNGQAGVVIHFNGSGIDTDTSAPNTRPIFWIKKTGEISIQGDNVGTAYGVTTAYQDVYATFDLSSAIDGAWDIELTNMDGQVSTCGGCLMINANGPTVTGINPSSGFDLEILSGISINGSNFDAGATVKLTKSGESDIIPSTPLTRVNATLLNGGAFDLSGKATGTWTVVVTNSDSKTGSYSGLSVNSAISNIYQFADNTDLVQPPTSEVIEGGGVGNQSVLYFRLDMESNKNSGETLIPEVEAQPIGIGFQCVTSGCPEKTSGFFAQTSLPYSGVSLRDWLNISGITSVNDGNYHWRIRLTNSSGKIGSWIEFGTDPQATNVDFYFDNTPPLIAGECPASNISDAQAMIDWNTNVNATAQVEYKLGAISESWGTPGSFSPVTPKPVEASPHTIALSGLTPGSNYVFRVRSKDNLGNEALSGNCAFTTGAAMPIKTVELFIMQEAGFIENTQIFYPFTVTIPESDNNPISIKSSIIEIGGVSGAATNDQTINIGFLRGSQTVGPSSGSDFIIESTSNSSTPFTILFDALNPPGPDQENMSDLTIGGYSNSKTYTLFLKGNASPSVKTYIPNAKLILTYSYTP